MKAVVIKARRMQVAGRDYEFKPGDVVECSAEEFNQMYVDGLVITEAEHASQQKIKAMEAQQKERDKERIVQAVAAAKKRGAVAPKDEAVQAKAIERFESGKADADVLVETIEALQSPDDKVLQARFTQHLKDEGGAVRAYQPTMWMERGDPRDAAVHACEIRKPMQQLLADGKSPDAVQLARESSAVLATEVWPLIQKGANFRIQDLVRAADVTDGNVGTIAGSLVLMRNLGFLKTILNFMPYISTDFRNEPARFNQPVFTRYITPPSVTSFSTSTGWSKSTESTTDVSVTMDQHKGVEVRFDTQLLGSTVRALLAEQMAAQVYSLGLAVVSDFLETIFGAAWSGNVTGFSLGSSLDLAKFVALKNRMTLNRMPFTGRFALLHSYYYDGLLTDGALQSAKAIMALVNKDMTAMESGELPVLYGVKPLESQIASANSGTLGEPTVNADGTVDFAALNQVGFLGNSASAIFVARVPQDYTQAYPDLPATAAIEVVTDPDTGLSLLNCRYVNHQLANISNRVSLMWGFGQGHPNQGIVLAP